MTESKSSWGAMFASFAAPKAPAAGTDPAAPKPLGFTPGGLFGGTKPSGLAAPAAASSSGTGAPTGGTGQGLLDRVASPPPAPLPPAPAPAKDIVVGFGNDADDSDDRTKPCMFIKRKTPPAEGETAKPKKPKKVFDMAAFAAKQLGVSLAEFDPAAAAAAAAAAEAAAAAAPAAVAGAGAGVGAGEGAGAGAGASVLPQSDLFQGPADNTLPVTMVRWSAALPHAEALLAEALAVRKQALLLDNLPEELIRDVVGRGLGAFVVAVRLPLAATAASSPASADAAFVPGSVVGATLGLFMVYWSRLEAAEYQLREICNVFSVFVGKQYRGLSVGSRLMDELATLATSRGCAEMSLEVRQSNKAAQRMYFAKGFTLEVRRTRYSFG